MIAKSTEVASFGSVDELASTEGHEVEMLDAFVIVGNHALAECILGDDLSDVLEDEVVGFEVGVGT